MEENEVYLEGTLGYYKSNKVFLPHKFEIKKNVLIVYESNDKKKIKKKIYLNEFNKMSVYADQSWEIVDKNDITIRALADNKSENDKWRTTLEKLLCINMKNLNDKNEFEVNIDFERTTKEYFKYFDQEASYLLEIGEPFLVLKNLENDKIVLQVDYKTHLRNYGFSKHSEMKLSFGRKFIYGEGFISLSFVDDKTSNIVFNKISDKAEKIRQKDSSELLPEEKAQIEELNKIDSKQNPKKFNTEQLDQQYNRNNFNTVDYINNSLSNEDLYETASIQPTFILSNSKYNYQQNNEKENENKNLNIRRGSETDNYYINNNNYNNKIKPLLPAKPQKPKNFLNQMQPPSNESFYITSLNQNHSREIFDKLLNTPNKVLNAKRLKEKQPSSYEYLKYED